MKMPVLDGLIDRRILINYRVRPDIVKALLPPHLEPLVVNGYASAGICLLRLKGIGIKHFPKALRITSENAAHRFLVTYTENGKQVHGVYIPRRDTDSSMNVLLAGKLLSWPHYPATFNSKEANGHYAVSMESNDQYSGLSIEAEVSEEFPTDSMFDSLEHASTVFQSCPIGVSPSTQRGSYKSILLKTNSWMVKPLVVRKLQSSYFEDRLAFPETSIQFDNALLMEGIAHEWHSC
jgi:hypothetical protein